MSAANMFYKNNYTSLKNKQNNNYLKNKVNHKRLKMAAGS